MDSTALFKITYGLYLLTAKDQGQDNGCIINTLMQITSSDPCSIIVSVNKENLTHNMIVNTGEFNVSMLTKDTPFRIFEHFGFQSGHTVEKFNEFIKFGRAANGIVYLNEFTNSYISAKVTNSFDCDTHTIFYANITGADNLSDVESITYEHYHHHTKPQVQGQSGKYVCNICGFIYEGDVLPPDYICPLCKHGATDFSKIS